MRVFLRIGCAAVVLSGVAGAQGKSAAPVSVQAPVQADSAALSKKGYEYWKANSDMSAASVSMKTKSGAVVTFASVHTAREASSGMATGRDAASGLPTGKRMHKPFVITKEIDKASPILAAAAANHEVIPEMMVTTLDAASKDAAKAKTDCCSVGAGKAVFQDLSVMSVRKVSATMEEVTFTFQKIEAMDRMGKTMAEDDWAKN